MLVCNCVKCGHSWNPRSTDKPPVMCPHCKRRDWDGIHNALGRLIVPAVMCNCGKCGYKWKRRNAGKVPQACPNCKRYDWQSVTPQDKCFMCGGAGCSVCVPAAAVSCINCQDRGMVRDGGCPMCGKVFIQEVSP